MFFIKYLISLADRHYMITFTWLVVKLDYTLDIFENVIMNDYRETKSTITTLTLVTSKIFVKHLIKD